YFSTFLPKLSNGPNRGHQLLHNHCCNRIGWFRSRHFADSSHGRTYKRRDPRPMPVRELRAGRECLRHPIAFDNELISPGKGVPLLPIAPDLLPETVQKGIRVVKSFEGETPWFRSV